MDTAAKIELTDALIAYMNCYFIRTLTLDYDITNIDFYATITKEVNNAETIIADFTIEKDLNAKTISLTLTDSQINTLGIGSYKFYIKQVSLIPYPLVAGKLKIVKFPNPRPQQ